MYTLLKSIKVRDELLKKNIRVFTAHEFALLFSLSPSQTKYFLEQLVEEELFRRLKRGLYALKTDPPSEEEIANALYAPSYISFEYALAYYNLIPEMAYQVTSATTKPTRVFSGDILVFAYYTIKIEAYTGYTLVQQGDRRFFMAEPEKALIDYLYFVALGQRSYNDRINTDALSKEKIFAYACLYRRPKLNTLVKNIL